MFMMGRVSESWTGVSETVSWDAAMPLVAHARLGSRMATRAMRGLRGGVVEVVVVVGWDGIPLQGGR